jgi:hypothetical protein
MLTRRRVLLGTAGCSIAAIGADFTFPAIAAAGREISPRDSGAVGDGVTDDTHALKLAIAQTASTGEVLLLDRWYRFSGPLSFPDGIVVRGIGLDKSGLVHDGSGDAVICSGACDLDNFTIDGGRKSGASRLKSVRAAILAIHGPLTNHRGEYLSGVRIGTIRLRNSNYVSALALVNLADADIGDVRIEDSWGHGVIVAGLKNCRFGRLTVENVGNLDREGSRIGSALAIFPERNPLKEPGTWYVSGSELPTVGLVFDNLHVKGATDTAVYLHDYGETYGVSDIRFGTVSIRNAGKDGFKVRDFVKNVQVDSLVAESIGLRALVIENGVSSVNVSKLSVTRVGYDTISEIVGQKLLGSLSRSAQTISTVPAGVGIFNAKDVRIADAEISDIRANVDTRKYGYGIWIRDVDHLTLNAKVHGTDGAAARIAHLTNFKIKVESEDVSRVAHDPEIVFSDDGTRGSANGEIRLSGIVGSSQNDIRVSGDSSNIRIFGSHAPRIDPHALSQGVRAMQ